ncbi:MAG TPA: ATP-binding cassette domain-containing protein, partial [Bacteroidota bacterium]|nr:ATP-binding cassette domain-containing protein [Bacteroidota bacterium]
LASAEAERGLYVFDEPTGSLDRDARDRFLDRLFARFRLRHETILLVTHDYGMIAYVRSRHRDLESRVRFLELTLGGGGARTRTFDPGRFLSWLEAQHPAPPPPAGPPVLRVESPIRVYDRVLTIARRGEPEATATLAVRPGDLVYLKAGSGVGKTTVAKIVIGLEPAVRFRIEVDGVRLGEVSPRRYWRKHLWGKKITMAFQHADEALNPHASVAATLRILGLASLRGRDAIRGSLGRLFDEDELDTLLTRNVWQLSGGQKQRLNILRALALGTPIVILDEPLSALDFESIDRVLGVLREVRERGTAILLISHNEDIFDRLVAPASVYTLSSNEAAAS